MFAGFLNMINESAAFLESQYAAGQKDPYWIGAWWLGFLILGVAVLATAPLLALFDTNALQKRIREKSAIQLQLQEKRLNGEHKTEEEKEKEVMEAEPLTKMEEASYVDIYGDVEVEEPPARLSFKG